MYRDKTNTPEISLSCSPFFLTIETKEHSSFTHFVVKRDKYTKKIREINKKYHFPRNASRSLFEESLRKEMEDII